MTEHKKQPSEFEEGAGEGAIAEPAPGEEGLTNEQIMDRRERKVDG
jgi:hypothetical protein